MTNTPNNHIIICAVFTKYTEIKKLKYRKEYVPLIISGNCDNTFK